MIFSPHCTFEDLGAHFVQQNWLVTAHVGFLEVAREHGSKDDAFHRQDQLVAFVVLTKIRNFIQSMQELKSLRFFKIVTVFCQQSSKNALLLIKHYVFLCVAINFNGHKQKSVKP